MSPASLCTYQCKAGGGGGREWGGDLIVFVGPGVGRLTDLVLLEELIFESFFAQRRGDIWRRTRTKDTETEHPCFTHAPLGLKRSGNHGGQRGESKGEWISLFCLKISFVLASLWSMDPFKILRYQSKRKQRETVNFDQYNWSVYGSFGTNGILKLTKYDMDFLLKVSVFYAL